MAFYRFGFLIIKAKIFPTYADIFPLCTCKKSFKNTSGFRCLLLGTIWLM